VSALKYWIWLSSAVDVRASSKIALLSHYGDAETAFMAPSGEFASIEGISQADAARLEKRDISSVSRIIELCAQQGITIVSIQDAAYPARLRNIYDPPVVLYVKGTLPAVDDNVVIAVIGTRKASPYGLKMGRDIAYSICKCGGMVVSGLTSGVDAAAAHGALLAGGTCIGVLGTSHDCAEGRLFEDVASKGALISEYPPETVSQRSFFRARNRIAAGLSVGVVVAEAPEKSGTRLFADEAAEQGKEIFAVPGNADAVNSAGTNALLKEGAMLVTSGIEVMSEFAELYPDKIKLVQETTAPLKDAEPVEKKEITSVAKKGIDKPKSRGYIDLKAQLATLTEDQLKIVMAIDNNSTHIDDIIEATGLPTGKVLAQLTILEIKGFVRREAGRRITLNTVKK